MKSFDGHLMENGFHGAYIRIVPQKGYVFASDVTVVINGMRMPANHIYKYGNGLGITYILGMEGEPYFTALPPKTGDDSRPLLWAGLMAASLCAACTLRITRRRRRMN